DTATIRVVRPDAEGLAQLAQQGALQFEPLGNHTVRAGETLTLQLAASGVPEIVCKMFPQPEIVPLSSFDPVSGAFRLTPTTAATGKQFEVTSQACAPMNNDCDPNVQVHQTIYLSVVAPPADACPDYVPANCTELTSTADLPQPVEGCYVIRKAGAYYFDNYI